MLRRYPQLFALLFFLLFMSDGHTVMEITAGISYSKKVYGENKENSIVNRTYSGSWALYFFKYTGLELNYAHSTDIITENDQTDIGSVSIVSVQNKVITKNYGAGIRQAFAPQGSFLIPVLSFGYVKVFKSGGTDYTFLYDGNKETLYFPAQKTRTDSVFTTFSLRIKMTRLIYLNGSVKCIYKPFIFKEATDNIKYEAGLTWVF